MGADLLIMREFRLRSLHRRARPFLIFLPPDNHRFCKRSARLRNCSVSVVDSRDDAKTPAVANGAGRETVPAFQTPAGIYMGNGTHREPVFGQEKQPTGWLIDRPRAGRCEKMLSARACQRAAAKRSRFPRAGPESSVTGTFNENETVARGSNDQTESWRLGTRIKNGQITGDCAEAKVNG